MSVSTQITIIQVSVFVHMVIFTEQLFVFTWSYLVSVVLFLQSEGLLLGVSCSNGLMITYCLSINLTWEVLIFSHIFEGLFRWVLYS